MQSAIDLLHCGSLEVESGDRLWDCVLGYLEHGDVDVERLLDYYEETRAHACTQSRAGDGVARLVYSLLLDLDDLTCAPHADILASFEMAMDYSVRAQNQVE